MYKTIFGKKQFLLAGLIIALGAAVYLNYHFATKNPLVKETAGKSNKTSTTSSQENVPGKEDEDKNLGESIYVNGKKTEENKEDPNDYFVKSRKSREVARKEALDIIKDVSGDVSISEETLKEVLNRASSIAKAVEQESKIESLIKAKDFSDCVVYIENNKCSVVVKGEALTPVQILQITDIITTQSAVIAGDINIVPIK